MIRLDSSLDFDSDDTGEGVARAEMQQQLARAFAGVHSMIAREPAPDDIRLAHVADALRRIADAIGHLRCDARAAFVTRVAAVDVCALLHSRIDALEGVAVRHGIRLTVHGCTRVHRRARPYRCDPLRITEVVTNVVMNAIRHTASGREVRVSYERDTTMLTVRISDEGPGIEPAERSRVFEDGYRSSPAASHPGSGIGLALVRHFVEEQHGTIAIVDGPLCGATFIIRLPGYASSTARISGSRS